MTQVTHVAMLGATGRMGRSIVPLIAAEADMELSGALAAASDAGLGQDAGVLAGTPPLGVMVTDQPDRALTGADVAIDFTLAEASLRNALSCREKNVALVIGTTGHNAAQRAELEEVARGLPIVLAPNMSLGVNVLFRLAELAARALNGDQYDA
jgi:4-hydroxy-tetrahydrodipicolinate reductase